MTATVAEAVVVLLRSRFEEEDVEKPWPFAVNVGEMDDRPEVAV